MRKFTPEQLSKVVHRELRWNPVVERVQQMLRANSKLLLKPIDLEIEIRSSDILIDCGANIGGVASLFARTGAQVYAFEPNPVCFAAISKRFSLTPNVTCFNQGVTDKRCTLELTVKNPHGKWNEFDTSIASTFMLDQLPPESSKTSIECVDLSEFILSLGHRVRLIKLDIEGSEIAVINGLIDTNAIDRVDLVLAETHEKQMPFLLEQTDRMKQRISDCGLQAKFRLDWI
jgi:FkbM family methyltransferase